MNELNKLDLILTGQIPFNFSGLSSSTTNRKNCEVTWNDLNFNMTDNPNFADTAVIVTSYAGHLGWLKSTLTSYRNSGAFVILAYDNSNYIWDKIDDENYIATHMFRPIHTLLAHSVVMKHRTFDSDKRVGWEYLVRYAQGVIKSFKNIKYVYCTNGDCLIGRPEGIKELPAILGNGDLMSGQSTPGSTIHTACWFSKVESFNRIIDYMYDRFKYSIIAGISPEALLRDAVDELGLKETFVEYPKLKDGSVDYYCKENLDSTWKKVLAFRNLYHEFEFYENSGIIPPPLFKEVFDPYMNWVYWRKDWQETICKYWETGDKRYLMMFWDRGKDTDTERKYFPLEHYGKEPIYER